jgi:hypothetical protein
MFELEQAISDWRRQMLAAGVKSPKVISELESHLREDIEQQMLVGLDAQQAFANAAVRLGHARVLKAEFVKSKSAPKNLDRFRLAFCLLLVAAVLWLSGFTFTMLGMSPGEWVLASSAVASSLCVAAFWRHAVRFLPIIRNRRKRYAIEVVLLASGFICSNLFCGFVLPYFERNLNGKILPPIWLWAIFPIAFFLALAAGIEEAARKEASATHSAIS